MTNQSELWSIRLPNGNIVNGTLDQLDDAFQSGAIAADTPVLAPGEVEWTSLGALAGLDAAAAPPAGAEAAVPAPAPAAYVAPSAAAQPVHLPPPPYVAPVPAPVSSLADRLEPIPAAQSIRPVTSDFDDEDFAPKPRSGGKRWVMGVLAFAAVAGVVGVAVSASRHGGSVEASAAAAPPPAALTAAPIYETPHTDSPIAVDSHSSPTAGNQLTAAQRQAIEAEKLHPTAKGGSAHSLPGAPARATRGAKGGDPFAKSKGPCKCTDGDPLCSCL